MSLQNPSCGGPQGLGRRLDEQAFQAFSNLNSVDMRGLIADSSLALREHVSQLLELLRPERVPTLMPFAIASAICRRYPQSACPPARSSLTRKGRPAKLSEVNLMQFLFPRTYQAVLTIVLFAMFPMVLPAQQHDERHAVGFTSASLCGNYGAIATYGANIARAFGFEV